MKDYIPPELLKKAKEMDLLTYLMNFNPSELVKITEDTYSIKTHDNLIISNNLWHRFSTNEGGKTALDYLIIDNKLIYQEQKTNNVVFIGYDNEHNIKYAGCRSTGEKRIMIDAKGIKMHYF